MQRLRRSRDWTAVSLALLAIVAVIDQVTGWWVARLLVLPLLAWVSVWWVPELWRQIRTRGIGAVLVVDAPFIVTIAMGLVLGALHVPWWLGLPILGVTLFLATCLCAFVHGRRRIERAGQGATVRLVGPAAGSSHHGTEVTNYGEGLVIVGALASPWTDAATCGAAPQGTTVLEHDGQTIASSEDPAAHPGALVFCYGPRNHRGRHTWETESR